MEPPVNPEMADDFAASKRLGSDLYEGVVPLSKLDSGATPNLFVYLEQAGPRMDSWALLLGPTGSQYQTMNLTTESVRQLAILFKRWERQTAECLKKQTT